MQKQTLNVQGRLVDLSTPKVMGIVNVTPDSFYSGSRVQAIDEIRTRITQIIEEGGAFVDVGAYSSRPGAENICPREEMRRLEPALRLLRDEFPEIATSVDTFRADVAAWAVEEYGVGIINDISGGTLDADMFATVCRLQVPYILMHMRGTPQTMQQQTEYTDLRVEILDYLVERVGRLRAAGLHDIIIDPGFGFGKTLEQNYQLMHHLVPLREALQLPMLVGISRKSMVYRALGTKPSAALTGTTALHTHALIHKGADILRVHDVRPAVECIKITQLLLQNASEPENRIEVHSPQGS